VASAAPRSSPWQPEFEHFLQRLIAADGVLNVRSDKGVEQHLDALAEQMQSPAPTAPVRNGHSSECELRRLHRSSNDSPRTLRHICVFFTAALTLWVLLMLWKLLPLLFVTAN
ncbi:MAG: hypothetical protein KDA96_24800, partial [Planctomycetaceae bacterium]|nr:hypothetical protein [Planctomycetaceae bacterium]